jgi:integrase
MSERKRNKRRHGLGNITKLGDRWRIRLMVGGVQHSFTIQAPDRKAVEQYAKTKRGELEKDHARKANGFETGVRFSSLLDRFERDVLPGLAPGTSNAYKDSTKVLRVYFVDDMGDPTIESLKAKDVTAFLTWRRSHRQKAKRGANKRKPKTPAQGAITQARPVSNRTLVRDRSVLHRVFAFADQLELREGNPVARVDAPQCDTFEPVILSPDEYETLVTACGDRLMLTTYTLLLGEAGLRCESEALWLQWEDIDFAEGYLWVATGRDGHRTKSGKGRWVPLTQRLTAALKDHAAAFRLATYKGKRSEWLFHHTVTQRHHIAGARITSMRHSFENAVARAKLPHGFRTHDLRHRRVTTWLAEGRSAVLVKEAMGHSDLRTTMGYTHLVRSNLKALVEPQANPGQIPPQTSDKGQKSAQGQDARSA